MQRYVIALDTEDGPLWAPEHATLGALVDPEVFIGNLDQAEQQMLHLAAKGTTCYLCVLRTVMTYKGKKLT